MGFFLIDKKLYATSLRKIYVRYLFNLQITCWVMHFFGVSVTYDNLQQIQQSINFCLFILRKLGKVKKRLWYIVDK